MTKTPPITCSYRDYKFISAPLPSSGGVTLCEILNVLDGYDLKSIGFNSAAAIHTMTGAMRHAYIDRNTYLGGPEFINNPIDRLTSKHYAAEIRKKIVANKATPSETCFYAWQRMKSQRLPTIRS